MATSNHQLKLNSYLKGLKISGESKQTSRSSNHEGEREPRKTANSVTKFSSRGRNRSQQTPSQKLAKPLMNLNNKGTGRRNITADILPTEILLKIFGFLTPPDLMSCSCVCHRWMKVAGDNLLWQPLYEKFKFSNPQDKPNSVYTSHANIKWKAAFMERCIERRNTRLQRLLKKRHPYTNLAANTDKMLKQLGIKWKLVLTVSQKQSHEYVHSDICYFNTSVHVRWYSVDCLPVDSIKKISVYCEAPILFEKDGSSFPESPRKMSLLLSRDLTAKKEDFVECGDTSLKIRIILPGVMVATWKDGGGIAFISLCIHKSNLVERCLLGHPERCFHPFVAKPRPDDIDPQYGLHDFQCNIELRQQRTLCWSERFSGLHCPKEQIKDGFVKLTLIRSFEETEHSVLTKTLCLPWKTDMFKGIFQGLCILDLTVFDEFDQPFWCVSHPVKVTKDEISERSLLYHGEPYSLHYMDEEGSVHLQVISDEDQEKEIVTMATIHINVKTINSWFSTAYS